MTAPEFGHRIAALGYSQRGFAAYVGANERTVRRWALGEQDIPPWVAVMVDLLEWVQDAIVTHSLLIGNLRIRLCEDPTEIALDRDGEGGHFSRQEFVDMLHKFISERL